MVVFVLCGLIWIVAFGFLLKAIIRKYRLAVGSNSQLSYYSLALGVFTVFAVGLNRPDFSDSKALATSTGGYDLYVDYCVPIQYDLNNADVRRKLSL